MVTSAPETAAKNTGLDTQVAHDTRYQIAEELLDLSYELWEGTWRDDAVIRDAEKDVFTVPGRV